MTAEAQAQDQENSDEIEVCEEAARAYDLIDKLFGWHNPDSRQSVEWFFEVLDNAQNVGDIQTLEADFTALIEVTKAAFPLPGAVTLGWVLGVFDRTHFTPTGKYKKPSDGQLASAVERLVKAYAIAEKVFGDGCTAEGAFEIYDYLEVAETEEEFAADLKRVYKRAKQIFKTEAPTPLQVFGLFEFIFGDE